MASLGTIYRSDGISNDATAQGVTDLLASGEFFWLSIESVDEDGRDLLLTTLGFHPLAVEDAVRFGQRPKIDEYDGFTYWVAHGIDDQGGLAEVHIFIGKTYIVTVSPHCDRLFDAVHQRMEHHPLKEVSPMAVSVLYLVLDHLVDSYFEPLAELDDRIDTLEDDILRRPTEAQLGDLFSMKRELVGYRKSITPQRDLMARVLTGVESLDQMSDEDLRYFRDLYDHLIRISDLIDSYRDLVTGAVDTHISMVSNRLNVIMKQLTIIATVFLPLSFLTGFFGQNFAVLVNGPLATSWGFWTLGIGTELAATVILLLYGRRNGWFGGPSA
ncbi:MAG: magnesium transporter CorA family protein [Marmoricola sp.]